MKPRQMRGSETWSLGPYLLAMSEDLGSRQACIVHSMGSSHMQDMGTGMEWKTVEIDI